MIQRRKPIARSTKPLKRSPLRRKRAKVAPRRGRTINWPFMRLVRATGCILRGKHVCRGPMTFHHIRETGSGRDDTWGVGLCADGHLHTFNSSTSVEALGKEKFQRYWNVDLTAEAEKNRERWERGERTA